MAVENKRILAIGAHPDDMEQFCGGTLSLLAKQGHEVWIVSLTKGDCGSRELSAQEIVDIRQKEAEKGAQIIGAKYRCLGIEDGSVSYDLETTKKLVALIREINPDIIFTHPITDYMSDHAHTGQLVLWAVPEAHHPNFLPEAQTSIERNMHVYHTDPQGLIGPDGQIVRVNTVVNITETIEQKMEAFSAHESQIGFLEKREKASVIKTRKWAVTRGQQVRVEYGEGFCQLLLEEYPRDNLLRELLEKKVFTL